MKNNNDTAAQWLEALDAEEYAACWNNAAEYFKNGVSIDEWTEKAQSARERVGEIQSRTLKKSVETTDIPAAPEGKYVISEYSSVFSDVGEIGERLTMVQEEDGKMRVVGYYLI